MTKIEEKLKEFGLIVELKEKGSPQLLVYKENRNIDNYYFMGVLVDDNKIKFDGEVFDETQIPCLISTVDKHNEQLPYPINTYYPGLSPWAITEKRVHWYLTEKLGFRQVEGKTSTYELQGDIAGGQLMTLVVDWRRSDEGKFTIYAGHPLVNPAEESSGWSFVVCYSTDDFKEAVCSLVSSSILPKALSMNHALMKIAPELSKDGVSLKEISEIIKEGDLVTHYKAGSYMRNTLIQMRDLINNLLKE